VVGVAEGAHSLAFQFRRDGTEVDSRAAGPDERLRGRLRVDAERAADGAVVGTGTSISAAASASTLSARPTLPWSAKARRVASGIVLMTSGAISSST